MPFTPPEPLAGEHEIGDFSCGVSSLDDWLKRRARANQASGATRTFVVTESGRVVAYYAIASGAISLGSTVGRFRRNMPDPIPVAVLARLAIDTSAQGQGLGRALFRDATLRILNAAETLGIRGVVVHAISDQAKAFYLALGFEASPLDPMTLIVTLQDLRTAPFTSTDSESCVDGPLGSSR
ncbi:GNAT family N-acetyltransferase [Acidiphilium sp.]|uniref:GNAT family N-acetyltransferase n=1 Tax=Acidiphilium sp. TaxID=527 RepID=UPI00259008E6|nr:GNAT family N-acetyltransferase [Acidiphilium sp.]